MTKPNDYQDVSDERCDRCGGEGTVVQVFKAESMVVCVEAVRCPECNGRGALAAPLPSYRDLHKLEF